VTDAFDITHGSQQLKFGVDFRRVFSELTTPTLIYADFDSAATISSNSSDFVEYGTYLVSVPAYNEFALFAQDDWKLNKRLSLSTGLRWELLPPPHNDSSQQPVAVTGSLANPSTLSLAPAGTPLWQTSWLNFAPRLGIAWQASGSANWQTVVRSGGGVFFDNLNQPALPAFTAFGFSGLNEFSSASLPLTSAQEDVVITTAPPYNNLHIYPPHLQLPYTLEWNASIEQGLGHNNIATISYIGSAGRRLSGEQELSLSAFNPNFKRVYYVVGVTSDYDALQAKFQRSISKGPSALASYTWSHSIDYGSNFAALPLTRGNSDFDVRNSFQGGITWDLPRLTSPSGIASMVLNGWGIDGRLLARTAYPVTLEGNLVVDPASGNEYYTNVNIVSGQPFYLYGSQYPGGKALNAAAFAYPTGTNPGDAPRNFVRGFGESQVNFAARRDFALSERTHLQFRAEAFNILNHPIFGYVDPFLTDPTFGQATQTLNQSLGTVASQYQQGGPRSMQFALHLAF
jgi:hypothetical protein